MVAGLQGWTVSQAHKAGAAHNRLAVSGYFHPCQGTFRPEHDRGKYQATGLNAFSIRSVFQTRRDQGMNLGSAAFFLPHAQVSAMVPEKEMNKTAHSLAANDTAFSRKRGGFFVAGWGLCYPQPHILPKASPLDSKERSALRFSRFKRRKKSNKKSVSTYGSRYDENS